MSEARGRANGKWQGKRYKKVGKITIIGKG